MRRRFSLLKNRRVAVLAALALAITLAPMPYALASTTATVATTNPCSGWQVTTLARGLGNLENVVPDGQGGAYLSVNDLGLVRHLHADGRVTTLAAGIPFPSGLRLKGPYLYVISGNAGVVLLPPATGALVRIDTRNGDKQIVAFGLRNPNGLLDLPDGTFLSSRLYAGGVVTGITRIHANGWLDHNWSPIQDGNGMVLSLDKKSVYVNSSVTSTVLRVPLAAPALSFPVALIPGLLPAPDDLDITNDGNLYLATHSEGAVRRVDPNTGHTCVVLSGLSQPTAVKVAVDGAGESLLVTAFDGAVRRLTPPGNVLP